MSPAARQAAYLKKKEVSSVSYKWIGWVLPVIAVCVIIFYTENHLSSPSTLPVKKIRVHGAFKNVDEAMLHQAISGVVAGGYFNVDVSNVRKIVEKLPWVSEASVRRVWPDTLSVSVVEQKPVAIAKSVGLINKDGDVFKPINIKLPSNLPVFEGETKLNKLMLAKYHELNPLLKNIKQKITYLKLDARHALELELENGLKIVLGRGKTIHRLERFMRIYNKVLVSRLNDIETIDLRYTNGMAIGWKNEIKIKIKNKNALLGDMKNV